MIVFRGSLEAIAVVFAAITVEAVHLGFSEEIGFEGLKEFSLVIEGSSFEGFGRIEEGSLRGFNQQISSFIGF